MRGKEVAAGLFAIGGVGIVAVMLFFLRGHALLGAKYYLILGETMGLSEGALVRVAGVEVGRVAKVGLTSNGEAEVCLSIPGKIRLYTGYDYTISRGALLGEPYVRITPKLPRGRLLKPGEAVRGRDPVLLEDALLRSQEALSRFSLLAQDLRTELDGMVVILSETAQSAERLSLGLKSFMDEAEKVIRGGGKRLEIALSEAARVVRSLGRAVEAVERKMLATPGLPEDIKTALDSVKEASESAQSLAGSLEAVLGDRELWGDLKSAVKDTREAAQEAKVTLERARETVEKVSKRLEEAERARELLKARYEAKVVFGSKPRLSTDFHVKLGDYVAGVRDAGGRSEVEVQRRLRWGGGNLSLGLVRGKPGLGYDLELERKGAVRLDLYGTERIKADFRARRKLKGGTDLVIEWRGVGSNNEIGLGIGYER